MRSKIWDIFHNCGNCRGFEASVKAAVSKSEMRWDRFLLYTLAVLPNSNEFLLKLAGVKDVVVPVWGLHGRD
jgi:hypothetical protein